MALHLNPSNFHSLLNKADVQLKLGKYHESIHLYDKTIEINTSLYQAYNNKGIALK